jgi:hypothetical protein
MTKFVNEICLINVQIINSNSFKSLKSDLKNYARIDFFKVKF